MDEMSKVLIVDDEAPIRQSLNFFLEDLDFDVQTTSSGEEGLEAVKVSKFDLAIVDMRLPGIDGEGFIEEAYKIKKDMQFIIFTGSVEYQLSPRMITLGIEPFQVLMKPLRDLNILADLIERILG